MLRRCSGLGGWGGHGLPVPVRRGASRGGVPWGDARVSPGHVPRGALPLLGHRAGCGGGQRVIRLRTVGGVRLFCVRPCSARAVFPCPGGLAVLQLGWGTPWCMGPVGRVVGARVLDQCHCARSRGGLLGGLFPHPSRRPLVGRGPPWLRIRGVLSLRLRVGRRPREGGGG